MTPSGNGTPGVERHVGDERLRSTSAGSGLTRHPATIQGSNKPLPAPEGIKRGSLDQPTTVIYYVDGACPNNGANTGDAWGSWARVEEGVITHEVEFALPEAHTNNEAEYQSLITLLERGCEQGSEIRMDSQLVVGQVMKGWKVKADNLRPLVNRAGTLVAQHKAFIRWVPREEVESYLGH